MLQNVTQGISQGVVEAFPSGVIGIITAILTVGLTFWIHRVRAETRTLRAIRSEIKRNEELGFDLIVFVADDIVKLRDGNETAFSPLKLNTSAYNDASRSGLLPRFSPRTRLMLDRHYTEIERSNQYLQNRLGLMAGSQALSTYSGIAAITDQQLLDQLFRLYHTHPNDELYERLGQSIDTEPLIEFLEDIGISINNDDIVGVDSSVEGVYYEDVLQAVEAELENKRFTWLF